MTEAEVAGELARIVGEVLGGPAPVLLAETRAADVPGWDSVRMVEIILRTEERFGIRLASRDVDRLRNFGDLAQAVHAKLA